MTTLEIVLAVLTTLFGGGGIFSTVMFFKQNRQLKNIEVKRADLELGAFWKVALDECQETENYYRDLVQKKDGEIQELNSRLLNLQKEYNSLELVHQRACFWKCTQKGCLHREPPQETFKTDLDVKPIVAKEDYINR